MTRLSVAPTVCGHTAAAQAGLLHAPHDSLERAEARKVGGRGGRAGRGAGQSVFVPLVQEEAEGGSDFVVAPQKVRTSGAHGGAT